MHRTLCDHAYSPSPAKAASPRTVLRIARPRTPLTGHEAGISCESQSVKATLRNARCIALEHTPKANDSDLVCQEYAHHEGLFCIITYPCVIPDPINSQIAHASVIIEGYGTRLVMSPETTG